MNYDKWFAQVEQELQKLYGIGAARLSDISDADWIWYWGNFYSPYGAATDGINTTAADLSDVWAKVENPFRGAE